MSYVANRYPDVYADAGPPPARRRISGWWLFAALLLCAVATAFTKLNEAPFDGTKIAAGTFPWPQGCQQRRYLTGEQLPHSCFDRFQKVSPKWANEHHFKVRRSRRASWYSYYRLGDDAVEKFCVAWEKDCRVGNVYQSVFVTDPRISDMTSAGWGTVPPDGQF